MGTPGSIETKASTIVSETFFCSRAISQQAGTGVKAPGQPSILNEGIQQTIGDGCVHADGISKLRVTFFFRAIIGMKPETNTSQVAAFEKVVVLPIGWQ